MTLRTKVQLIFVPAMAVFILGVFLLPIANMLRGYDEIETNYVTDRSKSVVHTMEHQIINDLCRIDWSAWDDVYEFVHDLNPDFVETNLAAQSIVDINVDTVVFVNENGEIVFGRSYDPDTLEAGPIPKELAAELKPGSYLLSHANDLRLSFRAGIINSPDGPILVGSRPILRSSYEGPARGSLIFARRFSQQILDEIGQQLRLSIRAFPADDAPPALRAFMSSEGTAQNLADLSDVAVVRLDDDRIAGFTVLLDIHDAPALILEVEIPRTIYRQAMAVSRRLTWYALGTGLLTLAALVAIVELVVVARLRRFSRQVRNIRRSGDRHLRLGVYGHDEIADLARDINALMTALDESVRKELDKEERLRLLTTHTPIGMFEATANGECTFVNPSWCEISGIPFEQALGDGWNIAVHPEDREWVLSRGRELVLRGEPFEFECRFLRPSGETRHVVVNVVPMRSEWREVIGSIGSVVDITARKRAEHELRESERQYRNILEMQAELVCRYLPDTTLTYVNDAYCTYFGRSRAELIGRSFLEVVPSDQTREQVIEELKSSHGAVTTRRQVRNSAGELRWQEWEDAPVRNADGVITEFQAIGRDITERKLAEDALRESEAKLRSITSSVADAIIMMDEEGFTTFWNEAAEKVFGYTRFEMLGLPLHEMIVPERYREAFHKGFESFGKTGKGVVVGTTREVMGLRKDGSEFPLELSVTAVQSGGVWHSIGTARDITERKRTQEKLEANARELEATNRQLETAIAHANQLALEAQVASVAKSDFVANMSHEIRTPLNGVIGMTTLLLDTDLTPEQREFAEMVKTSGEALLSVVNDILDFSKIEAGKLELECIEFDLRAAIEQVGDILAPRAQEKGLEFCVLIHHDVPEYVKGDPARLRQVLLNLAGNALKFTERGEIVVSAQLRAIENGHATVYFEVVDSGIGIPADRIAALFQPFVQVDSSTTRKYGGTGLGLTISKQLVEAMGGSISVSSTVGKGSTFHFTISVAVVERKPENLAVDLDSLAGLRMLAIEASPTVRKVYREQLRGWGVSVDECADTDAAYDELRAAASQAQPYAVALVDHFQRGLDVAAFAEKVKSDPVIARTRLILVTSWPKRGDAAEMARHGFEAYLTKPVKRAHLLQAIAAVASRDPHEPAERKGMITQHTINEAARQRARILLVEDNIINQKVAARMLEKLGYRCDVANNGREALDAVAKASYDLIFMDCQMPELDGFEATREIRRLEEGRAHTPIVALTASVLRSDHDQCMEAGMDDVLTKPLNDAALVRVLQHYIEQSNPVAPKPPTQTGGNGAHATTAAPVDLKRLSEITLGDHELEVELVVTFLADTAQRIAELASVISAGDTITLGRTAHALKGSAANMGAVSLQEIAKRLEELSKTGDIAHAQEAYERLKQEADRVKDYLSSYMEA